MMEVVIPALTEELSTIIQQAMTGDKTAFSKLVWRYKDHIINIAFGVVGNAQDAEDIAQEAFLKAYLSINRLTSANAFYRWLVKITVNLSIDKKTANSLGRIQPLESALPLSNPAQSPELVAVQKEQQRLVLAALEQLTLEQRTVWVLYEFQELPYNEIGQILNIPLGTVKSRISAARSRLREILAPERL
ncbi:RNA polymerase sigma-70 factor (ECF subfamily) [Anaerospora hongkongensis]|uniref:RNA polymerase sigma-70 factor (ECF subfamily) n=1 Tax=Anaerospora hongkongensis TaxID=244830 RepID=A0A4R1Q744_9FIRM|nr:sigma-70 family RNA polymerase sigma factor [Anaerospora hongkongensis]TCL37210.1 RNA polymerase sigma-70 factor (ECF subfamily) [Anaerospora hongkongensis]